MIYRLYIRFTGTPPDSATTVGISPQVSFLFDPANTDYQTFNKDIAEGKTLQDADGNEMTAEQIKELLDTLE